MDKLTLCLHQIDLVDDIISKAILKDDTDTLKKYSVVRDDIIDDIRVIYQIPGLTMFLSDILTKRVRKLLGIRE